MSRANRGKKKRILVLRYRFIGDTILAVPFFRNLRRAYPDAYIAWVLAPGSSDAVKGIPYVDELIYWDPVTIHADSRGQHRTFSEKFEFFRALRRRKFDTVYVLKRSFSSALMAFVTGARERIGFNTEGRGFLLTKRVAYRPGQHEVLNFLDVLKSDGIVCTDDQLEIWLDAAEQQEAAHLLQGHKKVLALHPFASSGAKSWPLERFAAVAAAMHERFGLVPAVLGGPRDAVANPQIARLFPPGTLNLVGACSLRTSMALLAQSAAFVGNDSGIMHLAAASGIPVVAVFGPTSPVRFGPWGTNTRVVYSKFACSPCKQRLFTECTPTADGRARCLDEISVEMVLEQLERLLSVRTHQGKDDA